MCAVLCSFFFKLEYSTSSSRVYSIGKRTESRLLCRRDRVCRACMLSLQAPARTAHAKKYKLQFKYSNEEVIMKVNASIQIESVNG